MYCKPLWIKASAKCISINVQASEIFFVIKKYIWHLNTFLVWQYSMFIYIYFKNEDQMLIHIIIRQLRIT